MKRTSMTLVLLLGCALAFCQPRPSIGKKFYTTLNKGFEAYYLKHDFKLAAGYFDEAFKVKEPDIYSIFKVADIYFREKQYEQFLKLREKGILLGHRYSRDLAMQDSAYLVLNKVPYYKTYQQKADSLYRVFCSHVDLEFTQMLYRLLGADQLSRDPKRPDARNKAWLDLMHYADSVNYFMFKEHIAFYGAPKMNEIGWETTVYLNLFYKHIVNEYDSAWGNYFLKNYFEEQYALGNLPNTFIPDKMDRDIGGWNGQEQVFGFFTKLNDEGVRTYDVIQNLQTVDSLRTAYDLPVLAVDALINGLKLPVGYKLYDRYTVLGR